MQTMPDDDTWRCQGGAKDKCLSSGIVPLLCLLSLQPLPLLGIAFSPKLFIDSHSPRGVWMHVNHQWRKWSGKSKNVSINCTIYVRLTHVCVWVCVCVWLLPYIFARRGRRQGDSECNNNNNNNGLMIVLVIGPQPGPQQQDSSYFFSIKCLRSGRGMFKDLSAHLYRGTGTQ